MNKYEYVKGYGDTITCDNCNDIASNWWSNDHAICGKCHSKEVASV